MRRKTLLIVLTIIMGLTIVACKPKNKFEFTNDSITIGIDETRELEFELKGGDVEFTMSVDGIVSITGNNIKGIKTGQVIITGKIKGKEVADTLEVNVVSEISSESLKNAFNVIGLKNHQMDVSILIYDEFEAMLTMKFDDNVSYLKEGNFVEEWYIRDGRQLTTIVKDGDNYLVTEEREPVQKGFLLFENLQSEWFTHTSGRDFEVKTANIEDLRLLFELNEDITIESMKVTLNEESRMETINIVFNENRDPYYMTIEFSNYGNVTINVPEVN